MSTRVPLLPLASSIVLTAIVEGAVGGLVRSRQCLLHEHLEDLRDKKPPRKVSPILVIAFTNNITDDVFDDDNNKTARMASTKPSPSPAQGPGKNRRITIGRIVGKEHSVPVQRRKTAKREEHNHRNDEKKHRRHFFRFKD